MNCWSGVAKKRIIAHMHCNLTKTPVVVPAVFCAPAGTRITFAGKGDELAPGGPSADLVFVVKQKPHAKFTRDGNDLVTTVKLPLVTALTGGTVSVQLLDGRSIVVPVAVPVNPGSMKVVAGEGMPISKQPGGKGDLRVKFDVNMNVTLTQQQKEQLRSILPAQ
jgi:DnaJ family protein B protein 4